MFADSTHAADRGGSETFIDFSFIYDMIMRAQPYIYRPYNVVMYNLYIVGPTRAEPIHVFVYRSDIRF